MELAAAHPPALRCQHEGSALLLSEYNRLDIVDLPLPRPGPDEVLVRVQACGICGSDVHGYDGASGRRIPPIVMGHEAAGIITAVGPDAATSREGDHVTLDSTVYCGVCAYCRRGEIRPGGASLGGFKRRASRVTAKR